MSQKSRSQGHSRAELLRRAAAITLALAASPRPLDGLLGTGTALAASAPTLTTEDVALPGAPALSGRRALASSTERFTLVGLHWQGAGHVLWRARTANAWGTWQRAVEHEQAEPSELPATPWRLGTPVWTGEADGLQLATEGEVTRLRVHRVLSTARRARRALAAPDATVIPRASWGADESIVRAAPSYADRLQLAIVHHTAGRSPATPEESAAVVQAIQVYHVKSNGWNDIGYSFLVDPFGQIFEGRGGGIDRNVIGAHALGFNTGTTAVALLGTFQKRDITPEARAALVALLAWRLDVGHVDPASRVDYGADGAGVTLAAVSGHRDVNATECPGDHVYTDLAAIAAEAAALGLPKLYEVAALASDLGIRFTGRLSDALPWAVDVTSKKGVPIASGAGTGRTIDWTWPTDGVPAGTYAYTVGAAADIRAARGTVSFGAEPPPVEEPPPPRPARPGGLPRRIPSWAWELRAWHLTPAVERGPRPATAPRRLPAWYWTWFRWQSDVRRWEDEFGTP